MAALARAVRALSQPARFRRAATTQRVHALSTLSRSHALSTAAAAIDEDAEWSVAFKDATDAFSGEDSHETSAQRHEWHRPVVYTSYFARGQRLTAAARNAKIPSGLLVSLMTLAKFRAGKTA